MSNIKFYPMHREQKKAHESRRSLKGIKNNTLGNLSLGDDDKRCKTLELRIKSLLDKYKNDVDTREKILQELSMYRVNITICQELGDKKSLAKRTKEFHEFLSGF